MNIFTILHRAGKWSFITRKHNDPGANLIQKFTLPWAIGFFVTKFLHQSNKKWENCWLMAIISGFLGFLAVWVGLLHNPLFEGDGNLCKKLWHIQFTCSTRKNSFGPKARSAPVIASSVVWFWSKLTIVCKFQ